MLAEVKNMDMEWAISVSMERIKPKFDVKIELPNFKQKIVKQRNKAIRSIGDS